LKKRSIKRRGQSEVIGGIIVLTLLFMFAVPLLFQSYQAIIKAGQENIISLSQEKSHFNEKLSVGPVDPNDELAIRAGWIPGVWINNTGSVSVTLDKLILVNELNHTIYRVYDLKYTRPGTSPEIAKMLLNVDVNGYGEPPPPKGEPIILDPGEKLLVVFNTTILPVAPNLIVLVESSTGVIHPIAGGGRAPQLYPGRPQAKGGIGGWRGIFAPQSGFTLRGYDELVKYGQYYAWRPPIFVQSEDYWGDPYAFDFYSSFIYEDPKYPGLYMLKMVSDDDFYLYLDTPYGSVYLPIYSGYTIEVRGYVGTYDTGPEDNPATYVSGYAFEVIVYNSRGKLLYSYGPYSPVNLGTNGIEESDFDGNGVQELTFYSYLNGPNYASPTNIDADDDGSRYTDALVWTYMVARDISGVDYVKITVKMNYYWTDTFRGSCPSWNFRHLKIFAIVVWKYNATSESWEIYQYQNYGYTSEKPVQFQPTVVFPLQHNGTYRVGVMIYDNYRDWEGYNDDCWKDFTMSLEHMIVEYGVHNPYFIESPPLYIVAIPDPNLIGDIGEKDYANAYNISDLDVAKVDAQKALLNKIESELEYAGIAGYTVINDTNTFCGLLFSDNPPKYAVIMWLQGNVTPSQVAGSVCDASYSTIRDRMDTYHWVWEWAFGKPLGDTTAVTSYFNYRVTVAGPGNYTGNITENGLLIRKKMYAYYLFNQVPFNYTVNVPSNYLLVNGTLYQTGTSDYGTVAFYTDTLDSVLVLNPVHIDWDQTGDGAIPETVAQQDVYAALYSWVILRGS